MSQKPITASARALSAALAELGIKIKHQQAQHVVSRLLGEKSYHVLASKLRLCHPVSPSAAQAVPGILVQVDEDFVPEDGDAFDAVVAALEHFQIPAVVNEGRFVRLKGSPLPPKCAETDAQAIACHIRRVYDTIASATAWQFDDSPLIESVAVDELRGDPENQVFHFSWQVNGMPYSETLTEDDLAHCQVVGDGGAVLFTDENGETVELKCVGGAAQAASGHRP